MSKYVTHQFAHPETLDRAERWLRLCGFHDDQIEVHREGVPWISVVATPGQSAEAEMIFRVAERTDPDGWPSFWETARLPHPHVDARAPGDATASTVVTARPSPVSWQPVDVSDTTGAAYHVAAAWDVTTKFETAPRLGRP